MKLTQTTRRIQTSTASQKYVDPKEHVVLAQSVGIDGLKVLLAYGPDRIIGVTSCKVVPRLFKKATT